MVNSQIANTYKNQQIMTAPPEQLTLLLYNGALRFLNESLLALEQRDYAKSHNANVRVQAIVSELQHTLDMKIEMSKTWAQLYEYIQYSLIQGNIKKDSVLLRQAKSVLEEMRDTWQDAMKQARLTRAADSNG